MLFCTRGIKKLLRKFENQSTGAGYDYRKAILTVGKPKARFDYSSLIMEVGEPKARNGSLKIEGNRCVASSSELRLSGDWGQGGWGRGGWGQGDWGQRGWSRRGWGLESGELGSVIESYAQIWQNFRLP